MAAQQLRLAVWLGSLLHTKFGQCKSKAITVLDRSVAQDVLGVCGFYICNYEFINFQVVLPSFDKPSKAHWGEKQIYSTGLLFC